MNESSRSTGGTALPADFSPQSLPGAHDQSGGTGDPSGPEQPGYGPGESPAAGSDSANAPSPQSDSRPRPFFADQPAGPPPGPTPGLPYGQPMGPAPRPGGPDGQGGPTANQRQDGYGQPGSQSAGVRQPRPASQRQGPSRPARPPERELRQRAIAALVFGAISLVALLGFGTNLHKGVYLLIFSAAVGISAFVIGVTALVKARKTGSFRPRGAIAGILLGALGSFMSVSILTIYLMFPTQLNNYVNCMRQAENSSDQRACMTKFSNSIHFGALASAPKREPGYGSEDGPRGGLARAVVSWSVDQRST